MNLFAQVKSFPLFFSGSLRAVLNHVTNRKTALLFCCFIFLAALPSKALSQAKLESGSIERSIESVTHSSAFWGVLVKDLKTEETLLEHHAKKAFIPASVAKLFTTHASLGVLGEDYRFYTQVFSTTPLKQRGTIKGNIILKGSGDPTFSSSNLRTLARELKLLGIKTIEGSVLADDTHFQTAQLIPHSEWEDLTWYYCPEVSALSINNNLVTLIISPESDNKPISVQVEQHVPYLCVDVDIKILENGSSQESSLNIQRGLTDNNLKISGYIPKNSPTTQYNIALHNPGEYARLAFIHELELCGISIRGHRFENDGKELFSLAEHHSPPLKEIINTINKESHNLAAELIYQEALLENNRSNPESILEGLKRELELDNNSFHIVSGSGLSRHNCLTPHDVCSLLKVLSLPSSNSSIIDSLPIAGVDGSLKKRFIGTFGEGNIKAKTGSLSGACSLAGYAKTRKGREVCFCIIVNHFTQDLAGCRDEVDQLLLNILDQN